MKNEKMDVSLSIKIQSKLWAISLWLSMVFGA